MIVLKKKHFRIEMTQEPRAIDLRSTPWIWFRSYRKTQINYGVCQRIDTQDGRKKAAEWAAALLKEHETETATFWVAVKNRIKNLFK